MDFSIFYFENTNQSKKWRAGAACCGARAAQASADPSICDQKGAIGGASGRRGRLGMGALALENEVLKNLAWTRRGEQCFTPQAPFQHFPQFISYVDFSIFYLENTNQSKKWRAGAACCGARAAQASADPSICVRIDRHSCSSLAPAMLGMGALALENDHFKNLAHTRRGEHVSLRKLRFNIFPNTVCQ